MSTYPYICICAGYTYEPLELEIVFAAIALFAVEELERFFSLPFAEHWQLFSDMFYLQSIEQT